MTLDRLCPPRSPAARVSTRLHLQRRLGWEPEELTELADGVLARIEGWRSRQDLALLYLLARDLPPGGTVVEIGSYKGLSTVALARGALRGGHGVVHTVDPHTGDRQALEHGTGDASSEAELHRNLRDAGVAEHVVAWTMTSDELAARWPGHPVRLLFVDGWHSYEAVGTDLVNWTPLVTSGGAILVDDYENYGEVRAAVDDASDLLPEGRARAGRMRLAYGGELPGSVRRHLLIPWG